MFKTTESVYFVLVIYKEYPTNTQRMSSKFPAKAAAPQAQNTESYFQQRDNEVKAQLLQELRSFLPSQAIKEVATASNHSYEVVRKWFSDRTYNPQIMDAALELLQRLRAQEIEAKKVIDNK